MKIVVTGGTGFIGSHLVKKLKEKHQVNILSRKGNPAKGIYFWDYKNKEIDPKALEGVQGVIHLAGASISKKWTSSYKEEMYSSRVESLQFLGEALASKTSQLDFLISASGVNYYGTDTTNKIYKETDSAGSDFLAQLCVEWENTAEQFQVPCSRTVIVRTGVVMDKAGGALKMMMPIFEKGLGADLGTGKQIMPCISLEDLVGWYRFLVDNSINGVYNSVAFNCTNSELSSYLAKALGKKKLPFAIPAFVLKLSLGEMSEILLKGSAVDNSKMLSTHFELQNSALQTLRV